MNWNQPALAPPRHQCVWGRITLRGYQFYEAKTQAWPSAGCIVMQCRARSARCSFCSHNLKVNGPIWQNQMHQGICLETSTAMELLERHISTLHAMWLLCLAEAPIPIPNVALISYLATSGHRPLDGKRSAKSGKRSFGCPCPVATDWHCMLCSVADVIGKPKVCHIFS